MYRWLLQGVLGAVKYVYRMAIAFTFVSCFSKNMGFEKNMSRDSFRQIVGLTVCFVFNILLAGVVLHDKIYTEPRMQEEINSLKLVSFSQGLFVNSFLRANCKLRVSEFSALKYGNMQNIIHTYSK